MARTANLCIRKTPKGWLLETPALMSATGKRQRRFFVLRTEAEGELTLLKIQKKNHGDSASILPPNKTALAESAFEILKDYGLESIVEAAREYAARRDVSAGSPTMRELFATWKTCKTRKPKYLARLGQLERRCTGIMETKASDLTSEQIDREALRDAAPRSRDQILRELRGMLKYATSQNWRTGELPTARLFSPDKGKRGQAGIYTATECAALLKASAEKCPAFVLPLALGLFAGIRPEEETLKITWAEIDLENGFIDVDQSTAKRDRMRHIEILPVLRAWLEWHRKTHRNPKGRVCQWETYKALAANRATVCKAAELTHKPDAYRHTFASFHLSHFKDENRLALELGHEGGVDLLHKHYFRRVKSAKDSEAFFALTPANVLKGKTPCRN